MTTIYWVDVTTTTTKKSLLYPLECLFNQDGFFSVSFHYLGKLSPLFTIFYSTISTPNNFGGVDQFLNDMLFQKE